MAAPCLRSRRLLDRLRYLHAAASLQPSRFLASSSCTRRRRGFESGSIAATRLRGVPADRGGMRIEELIEPQNLVQPATSYSSVDEYASNLDQGTISLVVEEFMRRPMVRQMSVENGLNDKLFMKAYLSFRQQCFSLKNAEAGLVVTLQDIITDKHDVERLFPFFLAHARRIFPHLEAMDDLRMISDLTQPHNWYPEARTIQRKIIFHAGPTNSGKTFQALQRFKEAKSGVFCGPLKLLASEVFLKMRAEEFRCDMVTGEERRYAVDNLHPSPHISCTVEMLSTQMRCEVAVIDEIQMLRDEQRGWAWTRALLGVAADEVHLCGEPAAIDIVRKLLEPIGETVEVHEYERKSPLRVAERGLGSLKEVKKSDCIVCFNKKTIFGVSRRLELLGMKPAVIYGDLPPGTKLAQAAKYNDPNDPTDILVATDAIGMGLNLNIKRVIFASLTRQRELIPNYSALQIAGRAGRFGTYHQEEGVVTTLKNEDIGVLRDILSQPVKPIEVVGIAPTYDQIETFSFHLPQASFVRLLDIFVSVCSVSDHFFICAVDAMKQLATTIDHVPLPLKIRYTLCTCPLDITLKMNEAFFIKMARRFSSGQALTAEWLFDFLKWPPQPISTIPELQSLEQTYEVCDVYLWLSLRFPDMLPDEEIVREANQQLDELIQDGIGRITELLNTEHDGKQGSINKTMKQKQQTQKEEVELKELEQAHNPLVLPSKRRGLKRSVLDEIIARGVLSNEEIVKLKEELGKKKSD